MTISSRRSFGIAAASAAVAVALASALAGCSAPAEPSENGPTFAAGTTMQKLADAGTINVGIKFDAPGYSERTLDGSYQGMDIEITKMVAAALGIAEDKIQWTETVSANREPFLEQGKVDMVAASYAIESDRQKVVTFAGPYVSAAQTFLVLKGNPQHIVGWDDVAGKKICAVSGSKNFDIITEEAPTAQQIGFDTDARCATALQNGQVDVVVGNVAAMGGYVSKDPDSFELSTFTFGTTDIGIGVTKGDLEFCQFIDGVMQSAWDDGSFQEAWDRTLKASTGDDPREPEFIDCA
jgi:glutamate transport system substrate-binding protein